VTSGCSEAKHQPGTDVDRRGSPGVKPPLETNASTFWPLAEVNDHWDDLLLRAFITSNGKRELYQAAA
jgi:hypothetical protein